MRKENKEKIFKGNDDFLSSMGEDAVQQQIQGEARFLRGLLRLIHRKKTIGVFILATSLAMLYFFVAGLMLMLFAGVAIAAFRAENYLPLIVLISAPAIFAYIILFLAIRILKNLWQVFRERNKAYQIKAIVLFLISIFLAAFLLWQLFLIIRTVNFII
ncbi:MAG: hypothetical protein AAB723_01300 [Patescibacteria group bacterium]